MPMARLYQPNARPFRSWPASATTSAFSAGGPPFFGLLFDYTQSYNLSFSIFIGMLFASAALSLFLRPPKR